MLGACKKKAAPPPPPPPPPPPSPTASISVSPDTIQSGQSATLTWQTSNATDVSIDGIGAVQANGSQQVSPTASTTYHLTAKGAGGTQEATTRLTVTPPPRTCGGHSVAHGRGLFGQNVKDIYFDYDKSDIRSRSAGGYPGGCSIPRPASQHQLHDRGTLRLPRLNRIQPGPGRSACVLCKECSGGCRSQRQPHQDHQLRQRKAVLHGRERSLLAAEPPRPLRLSEVAGHLWRRGRSKSPPLTFHVLGQHLPNPHHRQSV